MPDSLQFKQQKIIEQQMDYLLQRGSAGAGLLVFLHGAGEKGCSPEDLRQQPVLRYAQTFAPQLNLLLPCCPAGLASWPRDLLLDCIRAVADELDCADKIIISGISMGGRGVYELCYEYADHFRAAIILAAFGIPTLAARLQLPVWLAHGIADETVPVARADEMAAVLPDCHYQRIACGHNCAEQCFSDPTLWRWLDKI